MKIHTLWKLWDDDSPELLFALDELTIEGNYEVWEQGCAAAREKYKITEADTRELILTFPAKVVLTAFYPPEISAGVEWP